LHRGSRLSSAERFLGADQAKFGVRGLALAFIGRGSARPTWRAMGARPGKPGRNKAAASRRTPHQANKRPWPPAVWRLIATADPARIGIPNESAAAEEPRELSSDSMWKPKPTIRSKAKKRLIATFANSEIESSSSQQRTSLFSNRNKNVYVGLRFSRRLCGERPGFVIHDSRFTRPSRRACLEPAERVTHHCPIVWERIKQSCKGGAETIAGPNWKASR
jgi:hypothetical protein